MVTDANGTVLAMGGQFTDEDGDAFKTGDAIVQNINDITSNISIFPNPVKDVLMINGIFNFVDIYDVSGKLILSSEQNKINVSELAKGLYMLEINTSSGIKTHKITITK